MSLGSVLWVFKDYFLSNSTGFINSFICRFIPGLFIFLRVFHYDKKKLVIIPTIHLWITILGVGVLYFLDNNLITSGNGWFMFFFFFYCFGLGTESNKYIFVNLGLYNAFLVLIYTIFPEKLSISLSEAFFSYLVLSLALCITTIITRKSFLYSYKKSEEVKISAYTDFLTGCYNRKIFEKITDKNILTYDCALFVIDIDYFKKINDNYGHDKGDVAIKNTAEILKSAVRKDDDIVVRFGGDEFLIICKELKDVYFIYNRIINNESYKKNKDLITYSVGTYKAFKGQSIFDAIKLADAALYKSKENGRNQLTELERML